MAVDYAGIDEEAAETAILEAVESAPDMASAAFELMVLANRGGGGDNISCIVLRFKMRCKTQTLSSFPLRLETRIDPPVGVSTTEFSEVAILMELCSEGLDSWPILPLTLRS